MRAITVLLLIINASAPLARPDDASDFFERRVRPLLVRECYACHGPEKQFSGLRLDSKAAILQGGTKGPAALAGQPDASLMIQAVRHQGLKMPVGGKLKAEDVAALEQWVKMGLPWPETKSAPAAKAGGLPAFYGALIRDHWAFQPVRAVTPPALKGKTNPVDRFVAAKLTAAGMTFAAPAEKTILARRAAYVLTGLPPTGQQLQAFLNDSSATAYEKYVDGLLASPHYGERWARHWMDLARFAETYGYEWNFEIQGAWRYRDYLIRAFNQDVPYNQMVREQVAGDLMTPPRRGTDGLNESVLGTMFFRLGEMGHDDCIEFRELRTDVVDNQIDTLTKTFQGLTVSCSRCHDHKIDPIPTEDYYALYGILNSSRPVTHTLNMDDPNASRRGSLLDLKSEIRRATATAWSEEIADAAKYLRAALSWRGDAKDAMAQGEGLDRRRVNGWVRLLDRDKMEMDDPLYPFAQNKTAELPASYKKETEEREKFNREHFVPFADFRKDLPQGWNSEGLGLRSGPAPSGEFAIALQGGAAVTGVFPAGLYSNTLSDRLNGVLRSPILPKEKKYMSLQIAGDKLGAYRKVVDHCVIGEDHKLLGTDTPTWMKVTTHGGQTANGVETASDQLPMYVELSTVVDNPRFPERPDKFPRINDETIAPGRSYFGITRAVLHDGDETPRAELKHMARLFEGDRVPTAERFQEAAQGALLAWSQGTASDEDVVWIDWMIRNGVVTNSRNLNGNLRALTDRYRTAEASLQTATVAFGMADTDPGVDSPIFVGGSAAAMGRPAPRHFLTLMPASLRKVNTESSGRREVAEAIASPDNPLTSRVMVNRIWSYVFGRGIVGTTDNFGRYGDLPSHPELLDYLASRFVTEGWSVKKIARLLVTSETFKQGNQPAPGPKDADPDNKLLGHYPVQRMDAESVRDRVLAVSGRLDPALYGPSIQPHRGEPKNYRRLFQGPLDGDGRRSIYLKVTRMEGPRFLELFDFPLPMQTRGTRDITNVPSQALAMMNDPFVQDQAKYWAEHLVKRPDDAVASRLSSMFEETTGRPPSAAELESWQKLTADLAQHHNVNQTDLLRNVAVWKDVAHSLFCQKEFLYVR
ncbi:MAG: PSD1 and planctomycete cytochrome C domain-containing protein [Bryobacteraceae bacterium]